jgi:acyl-CoA synthetase (AMP-forming)/AMP-acid ligase II
MTFGRGKRRTRRPHAVDVVTPATEDGPAAPELADRFAIAYVAAHKAGAVVVPVNPRYAPRELDHIAASADPALIVTGGDQESRANALSTHVVGDGAWSEATGGDSERFRVLRAPSDLAEIL